MSIRFRLLTITWLLIWAQLMVGIAPVFEQLSLASSGTERAIKNDGVDFLHGEQDEPSGAASKAVAELAADNRPPYCVPQSPENEPDIVLFQPNETAYALLSTDDQKLLADYSKSLNEVLEKSQQLKQEMVTKPKSYKTIAGLIPGLKKHLEAGRTNVLSIIGKIPTTHRTKAQALMGSYFAAAKHILDLQMYMDPRKFSLKEYQKQTQLPVTLEEMDRLFPIGDHGLNGVQFTLDKSNSAEVRYNIALASENIFFSMIHGAGESPLMLNLPSQAKSGGPNKPAYLETVRCLLGKIVLSKFKIHQALINKDLSQTPLNSEDLFCLGSTASEFIELANVDGNAKKERFLRERISDLLVVPKPDDAITEEIKQLKLLDILPSLLIFPETLAVVNLQRSQPDSSLKPVSEADFTRIMDAFKMAMEAAYEKAQPMNQMRNFWLDPSLQAIASKVINDCKYDIVEKPEDFMNRLLLAEDVMFSMGAAGDLQTVIPRLTDMSKEELSQFFNQFLFVEKRRAVKLALIMVLTFRWGPLNPQLDDLIMTLNSDIDLAVTQIWDSRKEAAKVADYANELADKTTAGMSDSTTLRGLLLEFTEELIVAASLVKDIKDENVDPLDLKFDAKAVARAMSPILNSLDETNKSVLATLVKANSFDEQKRLWGRVKKETDDTAARLKVSCEKVYQLPLFQSDKYSAQGWVSGLADKWPALRTYVKDSTTLAEQKVAQSNCFIVHMFGAAIGMENSTEPQSLSAVNEYLLEYLTSEELEQFYKDYRDELASEILGEYRILDLPSDPKDRENFYRLFDKKRADRSDLKFYQKSPRVWQVLADQENAEQFLPMMTKAVEESLKSLEVHLKTVAQAKNENDLDFFIKRTKVINTLLGENNIPKLIADMNGGNASAIPPAEIILNSVLNFPELVEYHQTIQGKMVADQMFDAQVWDPLLINNAKVAQLVFGGWILKHVFSFGAALTPFPRFFGTPASFLSWLGSRNSFMIMGHGRFFTWVIIGQATFMGIKAYDFRDEQAHLRDLVRAEVLQTGGNDNPVPLIDWNDYRAEKKRFDAFQKQAFKNMAWAAFWGLYPRIWGYSFRIMQATSGFVKGIEGKLIANPNGNLARMYEWRTWFSLRRKQAIMAGEFRVLGNPKSFSLADLTAAKSQALQNAKSPRQIARVNAAYERILSSIGPDLFYMIQAKNVNMQRSYARVLMGEKGRSADLMALYKEYEKILLRPRSGTW